MSDSLPRAVNTEQELLVAVCTRLDRIAALIDERLPGQAAQPEPQPGDGPQPIQLREPEPAKPAVDPAPQPAPVELREPDKTADDKTTRPARTTGRRNTKAGK